MLTACCVCDTWAALLDEAAKKEERLQEINADYLFQQRAAEDRCLEVRREWHALYTG